MAQHLQKIYAPWDGNAEAMAADIDEKPVTVRQWRNRGSIPDQRVWPKIIRAAAAKGHVLSVEDFLLPEVKDELPCHTGDSMFPDRDGSATKSADIIRGDKGGADNGDENIREGAQATESKGEADSHGPFSGASRSTCSTTSEPPATPAASPTCSSSRSKAA